ncbi:MAG: helix-turn-helix domain-containing protein [Actinomycetota bacterium]|nr:helix-turn-helix domain-containing protein [Actinomycetota bacterium]
MTTTESAVVSEQKRGGRPAAEVVAELLGANENVTVAELASLAGLGQSTIGKALAALEATGAAVRVPGGRDGARRLPDRWSAVAAAESKPEIEVDATSSEACASSQQDPEPEAPAGTLPPPEPATDERPRLGKGTLGTLVFAYLMENPGDHGPVEIAKALGGKSSGAVGNALVRLTADGSAELVSEKPRRYRIAGDGAAADSTATDQSETDERSGAVGS